MRKVSSLAIWAPFAAVAAIACQTAPIPTEQPIPIRKPAHPTPTKPSPTSPIPSPAPTTSRVAFPDTIASTFATIETAFANDDCSRVLDNWNKLALAETESRFAELPRITAAAVAICNAKKSPLDMERSRFVTRVLTRIEQSPAPLLERAWLAKTLASYHVQLGEFDLAGAANQREKEYLLQYNARLIALTGAQPTNTPASSTPPASTNPAPGETLIGADKAFADAKTALNAGDPATAVGLLDAVPEADKNDKIRRLRRDAAEAHVKDLRTRARQQYLRAQGTQANAAKLEALQQCRDINEQILAKYPDTPSRPGIERSLSSIKSEIEFLNKGR